MIKNETNFGPVRSKAAVCMSFLLVGLTLGSSLQAQYPRVSKADFAKSQAKFELEDRHSDEAFAKAMPTIRDWAKRGKPYLPQAEKPEHLPQASIPAFPGAWGGGM